MECELISGRVGFVLFFHFCWHFFKSFKIVPMQKAKIPCHVPKSRKFMGAGEMADRLRALAAFAENLGSVPSTHPG